MPVSGDFVNISSRVPSEGAPPRPPPRSLFRERERWTIPRAPFIQLSKSPADEPSSRFPKRGLYGKRCPSPEPFLIILQGPRQGSSPSRFPSQSSHRERHSNSRAPFNHISKSPVAEPTPGCPAEPRWREMPIPRAFLSQSSGPVAKEPRSSSRWTDTPWYLTGPLWRKVRVSTAFVRSGRRAPY